MYDGTLERHHKQPRNQDPPKKPEICHLLKMKSLICVSFVWQFIQRRTFKTFFLIQKAHSSAEQAFELVAAATLTPARQSAHVHGTALSEARR